MKKLIFSTLATLAFSSSYAVEWSDTSVSWKYGNTFSEPFKNNLDGSKVDISKHIISLNHSNGYKYGTNYIKVDFIQSTDEPNNNTANGKGTHEAYLLYRNTVNLGKVLEKDLSYGGIIRGLGVTFGGDWNSKNDVYSSRKHLFVIGPTIMFDVPGFLNFNTLAFFESNKPNSVESRYHYDPRVAFQLSWGIPISSTPLSFEGYALWIDSKGINESGNKTEPEINIDVMAMYDVSKYLNLPEKKLRLGAEYQYWENKFGNSDKNNEGATSSTPMIRAEYKF